MFIRCLFFVTVRVLTRASVESRSRGVGSVKEVVRRKTKRGGIEKEVKEMKRCLFRGARR